MVRHLKDIDHSKCYALRGTLKQEQEQISDDEGDSEDDREDEGVDEDEDEEDEEDGMGGMGGRYSMRDRTRKEARYSPPKEEMRERQRCVAAGCWRARRHRDIKRRRLVARRLSLRPVGLVPWGLSRCLRGSTI